MENILTTCRGKFSKTHNSFTRGTFHMFTGTYGSLKLDSKLVDIHLILITFYFRATTKHLNHGETNLGKLLGKVSWFFFCQILLATKTLSWHSSKILFIQQDITRVVSSVNLIEINVDTKHCFCPRCCP